MVAHYINIGLLTACLLAVAIIGILSIFESVSTKRNYFFLLTIGCVLAILGHLGEKTSTNVDEAFQWVKILYIGGNSVLFLAILFIIDYSGMKKPYWFIIIVGLFILARIIIFWFTDTNGLIYEAGRENWFFSTIRGETGVGPDGELIKYPFHILWYVKGSMYWVFELFSLGTLALMIVIFFTRIKKVEKGIRVPYLVMLGGIVLTLVVSLVYGLVVMVTDSAGSFYPMPYMFALVCISYYFVFSKSDIYNIMNKGNVRALDIISESYILMDDEYNYLYSNPAAQQLFEDIVSIPVGHKIYNMVDWPLELLDIDTDDKNQTINFSLQKKRGKYYRAQIIKSPIKSNRKILLVVIKDITDSVLLINQLEKAANTDILTGALNRRKFFEIGHKEFADLKFNNATLYLMMFDLDNFKNINDKYGHLVGDKVLQVFSSSVTRTVRSSDVFCRYGGEEFLLLVKNIEEEDALKLADRIRLNVQNQEVYYEDICVSVTCSVGMIKIQATEHLNYAIDRVDNALYIAKQDGKNCVRLVR